MSDGFIGYKGLGWAAAALLAVATIMPTDSGSMWNALRMRTITELQRPGLLKKAPTVTTTTGGGTGTTTTTTPSTPTTTTATYPELSMIPSNFDINSELIPAPLPPSNAPDVVGAFRFICDAGQVLADDPIVYPGQPGASHLHQFYGNTGANAYSTYQSLRTTGQSTCMSPLNRSAYWMPAMLDGRGNVVRPDYVQIYYKMAPASSSACTNGIIAPKGCIPLPNGLRYIMGRDMLNLSAPPTGNFKFYCDGTSSQYATMGDALKACPIGSHFEANVTSPPCWNGHDLDSADHRSHMSYFIDNHMGNFVCPADHPYVIPQFTLTAAYTMVAGDDTSKWSFSSDSMLPAGEPRGNSFHADWFGAWDNTVMSLWINNCINKMLSCNSGLLGNGQMMKMFAGFSWTANPRLVPIPQ